MFIPGLCATTCPMAGLFCGGSGYLCAIASGENPEPEEERVVEMENMVKAPRFFEVNDVEDVEDDETEGRSFSPKMDIKKEKRHAHDGDDHDHSGDEDNDHQH